MEIQLLEDRGEIVMKFRDKDLKIDLFEAMDHLIEIDAIHDADKPGTTTYLADVAKYVEQVSGETNVTRGEASLLYAVIPKVYSAIKKKQHEGAILLVESLLITGSTPVAGPSAT